MPDHPLAFTSTGATDVGGPSRIPHILIGQLLDSGTSRMLYDPYCDVIHSQHLSAGARILDVPKPIPIQPSDIYNSLLKMPVSRRLPTGNCRENSSQDRRLSAGLFSHLSTGAWSLRSRANWPQRLICAVASAKKKPALFPVLGIQSN
jgi:hypothetical protein